MKKLFQVGDLLKYHFSDEEKDHYAIVLNINKERYVVHWLDPEGNPIRQYIVEWFESEMSKYFQKIS